MTGSLFRAAVLSILGFATVSCGAPSPNDMFQVGGRYYEYLHPGGLAIESGWRQVDLYRDDNGKRTLLARDIESERYYKEQDCLLYTTGHYSRQHVTFAACGAGDPLRLDTHEWDYWRMDPDALRRKGPTDVIDGVPVVETVPIDEIKIAVAQRVLPTVRIRPLDPNFERGDNGRTPVMDAIDPAASGGSLEQRLVVLQSLIAHGANVNAGDRRGVTPLMFACQRDDPAFIQPLLDAGAAVNVADDLGRTPLMIAAESFRNETVKVHMLLDAGADVTMRDDQGRTAAERISSSSNAELRSLLNAQ
jgi:hypothetical protein